MTLGALVDAGASFDSLKKMLARLPVKGYRLQKREVRKAGFAATKVDVLLPKQKGRQELRRWRDVRSVIDSASLPAVMRKKGKEIFRNLFEAEAEVHGSRYDRVHLHELAAVDCIVDIMGSLICLDLLGIDEIHSSAVNTGGGSVSTEHGVIPVPAPAAVRLLKDVPVYSSSEALELTTPTGAALISYLSSSFGTMPLMKISSAGTGAGDLDLPGRPNVLRVIVGEKMAGDMMRSEDMVTVIETNIDDMNPKIYEYLSDRLFGAGALDVFLTQIVMKKSRPAVKLSVICEDDQETVGLLSRLILTETSSIGLRHYRARREVLGRETRKISTPLGVARVKVTRRDKSQWRIVPEYDDCVKLARKKKLPLAEVMRIVEQTAREKLL